MAADVFSRERTARVRSQGRPSLEEAETIRLNLRSAAMAALLEQGDAATMNGIAQRAGISRKALYARYSSRSDLFADVIRDMMTEVEAMPIRRDGPVKERLSAFIADMLAMLARPQARAVQRLIAFDPFYLGNLRSEIQATVGKMFFEPLLQLIKEAIAEGLVRFANAESLARVVLDMIFSHGLFESDDDRPHSVEDATSYAANAHLVSKIILGGILIR